MLRHYFIIAIRGFKGNKFFSLINILGLSIGICASIVIYLIVSFEFSFDQFHKDKERIFRVTSNFKFSGEKFYNGGVSAPLGGAMESEITGIEIVVPFHQYGDENKVTVDRNPVQVFNKQKDIIFANSRFFDVFSSSFIIGSSEALKFPHQVVLTEKRAKYYFPGISYSDVLGKKVIYNDSVETQVAGIIKDLKENTDFIFQEFISLSTIKVAGLSDFMEIENWESTHSSSQLFVKLKDNISPREIELQLVNILNKYNKEANANGNETKYLLQNLTDIHFNENYFNFNNRVASKTTLYCLLGISGLILVLACVNFINLSIAQSIRRSKEVGIRKTIGGLKKHLTIQFITETFLMTFIAVVLSAMFTPVLLRLFSGYIPKGLVFNIFHQHSIVAFLGFLLVLLTFLCGLYPAFILARLHPIEALKDKSMNWNGSFVLRKALIVLQFIIAQGFIIAFLVVNDQLHYVLNKELGFRKDAIIQISLPVTEQNKNKRIALSEKIKAMPEVELVSIAGFSPLSHHTSSQTQTYKNGKKEISTNVEFKFGDEEYVNVYRLKLLAGRNLLPKDSIGNIVINEKYSKILGFKDPKESINEVLENGDKKATIVGVVSDFNQKSLHNAITPLALAYDDFQHKSLHIALKWNAESTAKTISISLLKVKDAYKDVYPHEDFNYTFFDESIKRNYEKEQQTSFLLTWSTILAVFISCLGLLGLVTHSIHTRTKEIGIRKVLGATIRQIIALLTKDFAKLIFIGFAIAVPIASYFMHLWLQSFAYRIDISFWVFLVTLSGCSFIALVTIGILALKAAVVNPVKSLRSE